MTNPIGGGYSSPNIALRQAAGLFVNVRRGRAIPGTRTRFPGADVVVIRELTEYIYNGSQQMIGEDAAIATKFVTRAATERGAFRVRLGSCQRPQTSHHCA